MAVKIKNQFDAMLGFAAFEASERTAETISTLQALVAAVPGTTVRLRDGNKSIIVARPDGTSALIPLSKRLQGELNDGSITPEMLGGCEIVVGTFTDASGAQYEGKRLQRPEGTGAGTVIASFTAYEPVKGKAVATGLTTEALLAQLSAGLQKA